MFDQALKHLALVSLTCLAISLPFHAEDNSMNGVKLHVPYIPQNDTKSCATTSVAMAISFYEQLQDVPLDKELVWKISGIDEAIISRAGNDMKGLEAVSDLESRWAAHLSSPWGMSHRSGFIVFPKNR